MGKGYSKIGIASYARTIKVHVPATSRRRAYTAVRRDLGKPGIGPRLIEFTKPGSLRKHGYSASKSEQARRRALGKAIKDYGALSVSRKLQALVTLRKRTQPKMREIFENDLAWVRENYKTNGYSS